MECICSMIANLANTVVTAVASADNLPIPSDMGRQGPLNDGGIGSNGGGGGGIQAGTFQNTHVLAVVLLALVVIISSLGRSGRPLTSGASKRPAEGRNNFFGRGGDNNDDNNGGGEVY